MVLIEGVEFLPTIMNFFGFPIEVVILIAIAIPSAAFLILMSIFTPGPTFLKAKFGGKAMMFNIRKDKRGKFEMGNLDAGMLYSINRDRAFLIDDDSVIFESKSGVPTFPVTSQLGMTLSPEILQAIRAMKEMGIEDIDEAEAINQYWHKCKKCGFEGIPLVKEEKTKGDNPGVKETIYCPKCKSEDLVKSEFKLQIPQHKTLGFGKILQYFKFNLDSAELASQIERGVHDAMSRYKGIDVRKIVTIISLISALGIAIFLIMIGATILLQNAAPAATAAASAVPPPPNITAPIIG